MFTSKTISSGITAADYASKKFHSKHLQPLCILHWRDKNHISLLQDYKEKLFSKLSCEDSSDEICRQLEDIEKEAENLVHDRGQGEGSTKDVTAKVLRVYTRLRREGNYNCTYGEFRSAAEHYDRTVKQLYITSSKTQNSTTKSDIVLTPTLKTALDVFLQSELVIDPQYRALEVEEKKLAFGLLQNAEKNLAHFFGNQIVGNKTDAFGNPLEGMSVKAALSLFVDLMAVATKKHPSIFSDTNASWTDLTAMFAQALHYASLLALPPGTPILERQKQHRAFTKQIHKDLAALAVGMRLCIPWGWSGRGCSGHAMFLIVVKEESGHTLQLFNTGAGIKYHPHIERKGVQRAVTRLCYKIPQEKQAGFETFLSHIVEPQIYGNVTTEPFPNGKNPFWVNREYSAEELYSYLNQYEQTTREATVEDWWSQGNACGICAVKSLQAVIGYTAKEFRESFKVFCHCEILRTAFAFEKYFITPNADVAMLLAHAIPNLARHLNKTDKAGLDASQNIFIDIDQLHEWRRHLQTLVVKPHSRNAPLFAAACEEMPMGHFFKVACQRTLTKKSEEEYFNPPPTKGLLELHLAPVAPVWSNSDLISAETYGLWLKKLLTYCKACRSDQPLSDGLEKSLLLDTLIRQCYWPFLNPVLTKQKESLIAELLEDEPLTRELMDQLQGLLRLMSKSAKSPHADGFLIAHGIYLVLVALAEVCDAHEDYSEGWSLSSYNLTPPFWKAFDNLRLSNKRYYNTSLVVDHNWIAIDIYKLSIDAGPKLFKALNSITPKGYPLHRKSPEATYIDLFQLSEKQHKEAIRVYEKLLLAPKEEDDTHENPSLEHWLEVWAFQKSCLPEQYCHLLNANLTLLQLAPWHDKSAACPIFDMPTFADFSPTGCSIPLNIVPAKMPDMTLLVESSRDNKPGRFDHLKRFQIYLENSIASSIDRDAHIAQLSAATYHPIRLITLLEAYRYNWNKLKKEDHGLWLTEVLFSPDGLYTALIDAPHLSKELVLFFEGALSHYLSTNDTYRTTHEHITVLLFSNYLSFLMIDDAIKAENEQIAKNKQISIANLRGRILGHIPKILNNNHLCILWEAFLNSYKAVKALSEADLLQIIPALFALDQASQGRSFKQSGHLCAIYHHLEAIKELLACDAVAERVATTLLHAVHVQDPVVGHQFDAFPLAIIKTAKGTYSFDIAKGSLLHSTLQTKKYPTEELASHPFYERLFKKGNGSSDNKIWEQIDHCSTTINGKRLYFYANGTCLQEASSKWYTAIDAPKEWCTWYPPLSKMVLWMPQDKAESACSFHDTKLSFPLKAISREGFLKLSHLAGEWEPFLKSTKEHPLVSFDSETLYLQGVKSNTYKLALVMPHCRFNKKPFTLMQENGRWHVEGRSNLIVTVDQEVVGLDLHGKFLVVMDLETRQQHLLVPFMKVAELSKSQFTTEKQFELICLNLEDNALTQQQTPVSSLHAAYLLLCHARTPEEYIAAFQQLEKGVILRRYSLEEFQVLERIIDHYETAKDHSPCTVAFCLNALLIALENDSQFAHELGQFYRREAWDNLYGLYLSKFNNVPVELHIETNFCQEIRNLWLDPTLEEETFYCAPQTASLENKNPSSNDFYGEYEFKFRFTDDDDEKGEKWPLIATKPGVEIEQNFKLLCQAARGESSAESDVPKFEAFEQRLRFYYIASTNYYRSPLLILFMELYAAHPSAATHSSALACKQRMDLLISEKAPAYSLKYDDIDIINKFIVELESHLKGPKPKPLNYIRVAVAEKAAIESSTTIFQSALQSVQAFINNMLWPAATLSFKATPSLFAPFGELFALLFQHAATTPPSRATTAHFKAPPSTSPENRKRIDALNQELSRGIDKNLCYRKVGMLKDIEATREELCTKIQAKLKSLHSTDSITLEQLERTILSLANRELVHSPKERLAVLGDLKRTIRLPDLARLVLHKDNHKLKAATGIEDPAQRLLLVQKFGEYLELSIRRKHTQQCLSKIATLPELSGAGLKEALQQVGYLLSYSRVHIDHPDVLVQLVLQWACDFIPRPNQLEILQKMSKQGTMQDIIQQVLQADGKTYVLGPYLALLHADGTHLAMHVDPKAQYETTLSTLGNQVYKTIGKLPYTFEYSDLPAQYTLEYFKATYTRLQIAVREGIPVITTQDSLRSFRARFIEGSIRLYKQSWSHKRDKFEKILLAMLDILRLMREKALFVPLEEVHEGLDPTKIHNIPAGEVYHFEEEELALTLELIIAAANAKDEEGVLLLDLLHNHQAQQTAVQKEKLAKYLAEWCVKNGDWRCATDTLNIPDEALIAYLLRDEALPPSSIKKKIEGFVKDPAGRTPLEFLLMTRQFLAGKWLENAFSKSVYEHFLIPKHRHITTAVPCESNMCPAKDSEFSNPFTMVLNTLIAGFIQGIPELDTFIPYACLQAKAEGYSHDVLPQETEIFKTFSKLLQEAGIEGDLFKLSPYDLNETAKIRLKEALKSRDPAVMRLVGSYFCTKALLKKKLYTEEVATDGINVSTMASRVIGYSGTLDNPYTSVVLDHSGRQIKISQDIGTDGQTLDLLINKNPAVYLMGTSVDSLYTDVIMQLPAHKQKRLRLIVDGGSHFRGVDPFDVASKMATWGYDLKAYSVVLSYDVNTRLPFAVWGCKRDEKIPVAAQRIDLIAKELNVAEEEIAVFLPQFKATGTDLALKADAVGIYTVTENTPAYLLIQEVRRLRELGGAQEAICALQQGVLGKMHSMLEKPTIQNLPLGRVADDKFIIDVLLFCYINRFNPLTEESYLLCIQNLKNIATQYLLDGMYCQKISHKEVFTTGKSLFSEKIAFDFVHDVGLPKTRIAQKAHLKAVATHFQTTLSNFAIDRKDWQNIAKAMEITIDNYLPALPGEIQVVAPTDYTLRKESGTMVQVSEQKQQRETCQTDIRSRQLIWSRKGNRGSKRAKQTTLTPRHLTEKDFLIATPFLKSEKVSFCLPPDKAFLEKSENVGVIHFCLDDVMQGIYPDLWQANTFSPQLLTSVNWMGSNEGEINIGDGMQKPLVYVWLMESEGLYSMGFTTQLNAKDMAEIFEEQFAFQDDRKLWLLRLNGDQAWEEGPSPYNKAELLANKDVRSLLVQAQVFSGHIDLLERAVWQKALEEWLTGHPHPKFVCRFFEEAAIDDPSAESYLLSHTRKLLRRYARG